MAFNPIYSESQALKHMSLQRDSGLSIAAYCRRHDIRPSTFYGWNKRLKHPGTSVESKKSLPFVELPIKPSMSGAISGIRISRTEIDLPASCLQQVCDIFKPYFTPANSTR